MVSKLYFMGGAGETKKMLALKDTMWYLSRRGALQANRNAAVSDVR
jgi:hypothetical protein